ncbi:FixH family protein [Methylocystis parvus]|nr:FixH family protein [Methylocystis parvus]WBK01495.1 FixH family protein [Methylocystis parvus OBBP]
MSTRKPLPESERFSDYQAGGKPLNGWKVLAMMVGFFLCVGAVNGVMIYKAVKTFSGEVTPHPYEKGLAYNQDIARAREQAARDWRVEARVTRLPTGETEFRVTARDADGVEITGVEMSGLLAAPADLSKDLRVTLVETAPGRFSGKVKAPAGQRDLVLTASRGGEEVFRSRSRIEVE